MKKTIKSFTLILCILSVAFFGVVIYYNVTLPDYFTVSKGSVFSIASNENLYCFNNSSDSDTEVIKNISSKSEVQLKLFGVIPIKTVQLDEKPDIEVSPCGSPFGIKLLTQGVIVVGLSDINTPYGTECPAKDAGLKIGDVIISINDNKDLENGSVAKIIENSEGKSLNFVISRDGEQMQIDLKPVFCTDTNSYKSGMWVRDSTAGIGTITYYDSTSGAFAGLGHPVCDIDTGDVLPILSGDVGPVSISGVIKGKAGTPGELIGNFTSSENIGKILYNTEAGVFGTLDIAPTEHEAIPVAYKQEIQVGPATIYSTTDGDLPKEYEVLIEKIDLNSDSLTKNMVIRITDKSLLNKSGGIVQGMSGSPIIQNGKLVGAVTHVFVNNPTMGYGIFCENMLNSVNNLENKAA